MEIFVLKNNKTGKYIGVDNNSGGYPYDCEINVAKIWTDKNKAKNYANSIKDKEITLHRLFIESKPIIF